MLALLHFTMVFIATATAVAAAAAAGDALVSAASHIKTHASCGHQRNRALRSVGINHRAIGTRKVVRATGAQFR